MGSGMPHAARHRAISLGPREVTMERRADGSLLLRSPHALAPRDSRVTAAFVRWAGIAPERTFVARRESGDKAGGAWRRVSYAQALAAVRSLGQALLDRGLSAERPLAILSDNDIEHLLLALAAQHVGVPYAPVSPAYSIVSRDHEKLRHIMGVLTPGLVFASDGAAYGRAIAAAVPPDAGLVVTANPPAGRACAVFEELLATTPTDAVDRAHAAVGAATVAKFLFTSGSTALPKGVINTHGMLCANQVMIQQALPFMAEETPVLVDWLPWNHTFGGNHNVGFVLHYGGTLYIDEGKPLPGLVDRTVANLREVAPTVYFNVPKGFELLVAQMEHDAALRERFFSRVKMLFYAGAGLSQHVWDALDRLAIATVGERILMITGLGATETAPSVTFANWEAGSSGNIGLPIPGQELKLVPSGEKLEIRVRGPNVTPGYWRAPEITRAAFDDEGYYRMGDAVRFVDPADPGKGLLFDGRVAEDFKLATGTWVSVGPMRARFIAEGAPLVQDVVIAGHDRDDIRVLVFPFMPACRAASGLGDAAAPAQVLSHPAVVAPFRALLARLKRAATGSATRIEAALLMDVPPSLDVGEMTDKGSINQRAVLKHRAAEVERLYAAGPGVLLAAE